MPERSKTRMYKSHGASSVTARIPRALAVGVRQNYSCEGWVGAEDDGFITDIERLIHDRNSKRTL